MHDTPDALLRPLPPSARTTPLRACRAFPPPPRARAGGILAEGARAGADALEDGADPFKVLHANSARASEHAARALAAAADAATGGVGRGAAGAGGAGGWLSVVWGTGSLKYNVDDIAALVYHALHQVCARVDVDDDELTD
jgi:hypothetical protein